MGSRRTVSGTLAVTPAVSILMPTFDRLQFLPPAIGSVLAQTLTDWELIIADDGSGEDTRAYLRSLADPRIMVLWEAHSGKPTVMLNAALRAAAANTSPSSIPTICGCRENWKRRSPRCAAIPGGAGVALRLLWWTQPAGRWRRREHSVGPPPAQCVTGS
jgi:glycosyltransferase involved in cell wall biosynthesis